MERTTKKVGRPLLAQETPRKGLSDNPNKSYTNRQKKSSTNGHNNDPLIIFVAGLVAGMLAGLLICGAISLSIHAAERQIRENVQTSIAEVQR